MVTFTSYGLLKCLFLAEGSTFDPVVLFLVDIESWTLQTGTLFMLASKEH
jgi:hypothetical protein